MSSVPATDGAALGRGNRRPRPPIARRLLQLGADHKQCIGRNLVPGTAYFAINAQLAGPDPGLQTRAGVVGKQPRRHLVETLAVLFRGDPRLQFYPLCHAKFLFRARCACG